MSKSHVRRCPKTGKKRYRDRQEAKQVITSARYSENTYIPVRTYPCLICYGWHLTSIEVSQTPSIEPNLPHS